MRTSDSYDAELVRLQGTPPAGIAEPVLGETLTVYGTDILGQPEAARVKVLRLEEWNGVCEGTYDPAVHHPGSCTAQGLGYSAGFTVERKAIRPGFSGGGAFNDRGELVGMITMVAVDDLGRDVASDLVADLMPAQVAAR